MQQNEFEALLKEIGQQENLPKALELLKASEEEEVAQAANRLQVNLVSLKLMVKSVFTTSLCIKMNQAKSKSSLSM